MRALRVGDKVKHVLEDSTGVVEKVGLADFLGEQDCVFIQWDDGWNDLLDNGYRVPYPQYALTLIEDENG